MKFDIINEDRSSTLFRLLHWQSMEVGTTTEWSLWVIVVMDVDQMHALLGVMTI